MNKKKFIKVFEPYNENGTQIWEISRIKKLPAEIIKMATRLADLDFIKYVGICDETLVASKKNCSNRPKVPITNMSHGTAAGIQIIYSRENKTINFYDINSPKKGFGGKMVGVIFKDFPEDW